MMLRAANVGRLNQDDVVSTSAERLSLADLPR